mgnify:CR=1 FL=1
MAINPLNITSKKGSITSIFKEFNHSKNLGLANENHLKLFYLDINSNQFTYIGLQKVLKKNIGAYVFSRATIQQYKTDDATEMVALDAVQLLRKVSNPKDKGAGGELGEILLYLFLEQILGAPKLLSKVELKTSNNQYVNGSDAVHLLANEFEDELFYQLVLGESKINGNIKEAVDNAFKSITTANHDGEKDIELVESNIFKESFDTKTVDFIKGLIVPNKRKMDISVDRAYGIFIGYTPSVNRTLSNVEFKEHVREVLKNDIESIIPYIKKKIKEFGLENNSVYIYLVPFNDAMKDRVNIIKRLKGEENEFG